ncbi:MAG: hypothetical protein WB767_13760 [Nocardioides sp.]
MTVAREHTVELIKVGPTCAPPVDGTLVVHHTRTTLDRGLELGEDVVLLDVEGQFRSGTVVDVDFTLDDTIYQIELGVRLPSEAAAARLTNAPEAIPTAGVSVNSVLDLLGDLRGRLRRVV